MKSKRFMCSKQPPWDKPSTWPEWRHSQMERGSYAWELSESVEDDVLSKQIGQKLGGIRKSAADLPLNEQNDLLGTLCQPATVLTPEQRNRGRELLKKCRAIDPHIVFDVDRIPELATFDDAVVVAKKVDTWWKKTFATDLTWSFTGGKGLHGESVIKGYISAEDSQSILRAIGLIVKDCGQEIGVKLNSGAKRKADRPGITLDDSPFTKDFDSRGSMWQLMGSERVRGDPSTRKAKINLETRVIDLEDTRFEEISYEKIQPYVERVRASKLTQEIVKKDRKKKREVSEETKAEVRKIYGPGTGKQLNNFGRAFMEIQATVGGKGNESRRHNLRLYTAGWLLPLGFPGSIVQSIIDSAGNFDDSAKAVKSTERLLAQGLEVGGAGSLIRSNAIDRRQVAQLTQALALDIGQAGLSNNALDELARSALVAQSNQAAMRALLSLARMIKAEQKENRWGDREKCYSNDPDTRDKARKKEENFWRKLWAAACCGKFCEALICPEHGDQDVVKFVCQNEVCCAHCLGVRLQIYLDHIRAKWEKKIATVTFKIPEVGGGDVVERGGKLRATITKQLARSKAPHRWFMGTKTITFFAPKEKLVLLQAIETKHLGLKTIEEKDDRRTARMVGIEDAVTIVSMTLKSANTEFLSLLETDPKIGSDRRTEASVYPFLKAHVKRTNANRDGQQVFPWPGRDRIRLMAKAQKNVRQLQEGLEPGKCHERVTHSHDINKIGTVCGKNCYRQLHAWDKEKAKPGTFIARNARMSFKWDDIYQQLELIRPYSPEEVYEFVPFDTTSVKKGWAVPPLRERLAVG